ncbi:MAG: hypothetical protein ACMUIE_03115 [Thermoplasmatota archaeon]
MEEETIVDVERKLVGRTPYKYQLSANERTLPSDSGFGKVGAKMDPKTGALMYDRYEDWITKEKHFKEEIMESNIRFSDDSGAMIHFKEDEEVKLDIEGGIKSHRVFGVVSVENRSQKDRIWDVDVGLYEETGIAVLDFRNVSAKEIEPANKVSREYTIDIHEPSIALEEVISTHPDLPESRVILKGQPSHTILQLGLKNLAVIPYTDVVARKRIPPQLKNVMFPGEMGEDVAIEEGDLVWRIPSLQPGEMRVLRYEGDIDPNVNDAIPTGDVVLRADGEDIITNIVVDSFEAMCKNMYFIEADETEEPGEWICRFVVENTSDFEVEIMRVEVKDTRSDRIYLNLDRPDVYIRPGNRWESDSWLISNDEKPTFIKNLVLNIVPGLSKNINYRLHKEGGDFYPAAISFKKTFDKRKVEAKRSTEVLATLTIENTGYADVEQVFVRDTLPRYFLPPEFHTISVEKAGFPLEDNIGIHVEPDKVDPTTEQQLFIRIDDLSRFGGPLRSGERLVIKYKTVVYRPEPEDSIEAPAEVDVRTYLPGPVIPGRDVAGAPVIDTLQILRKFSIGKSIEQGRTPGEYRIELLYRNRGSNPVVDLTMSDLIPENFNGSNFSIQPMEEDTPEGITMLEWKVPKIEPGQSLVISYIIKGEGEYHPSDAQIFYNASD